MANTYVDYTAGVNPENLRDFTIPFSYISYLHVKVKVNGVENTDFTVVIVNQDKIVRFNSNLTVNDAVHIYRDSAATTALVDFENGSVLTESELDLAYLHNLYLSEENKEQKDLAEERAKARANHTGKQPALTISDFDTEVANNSAVVANTAKVTNATHTGDVTGDQALTIANNAVTSDKISDTDNNFNIQSDGKIGMGCLPQADEFSTATLAVNGAIETRRDRQTGTPEGGQLILRSEDDDGYRWNIDNWSRAAGDFGSILRVWRTAEADGSSGAVYLTINPANGYVNIGSGATANNALDVNGDINATSSYKINGNALLLDEDDMASNSATQAATQQSIKAYIDSLRYSSGWVSQDDSNPTRSVAAGATLGFNHNLGTTDVSVTVWAAEDSSGTGRSIQNSIVLYSSPTTSYFSRGVQASFGNENWVYVQLADAAYHFATTGGYIRKEWGTGTDSAGNARYSHIKVVVQA
jgi:hypothetical protein